MLKSRKKMLLSSIAMLLVALVALGSATFAWYANVTSVTASLTSWNASTSDGLVIKHHASDSTWKTALVNELDTKTSLEPRAIQITDGAETPANIGFDAVVGASAQATSRDSYQAASHTLISHNDLLTDAAYLVDEMFVAGESGTKTVKMFVKSNQAADANSYLNLAVYVNGNLKEVFSTSTQTTRDLAVNGSTASEGSTYNPTDFTGSNQQVGGSSFTFSAAAKASGGTAIKIIAYADGFNDKCTTGSVDISTWTVDYTFTVA